MNVETLTSLLNSTTFPIATTIILLVIGYEAFNKFIVPLVNSCIESNKQFIVALEKINNRMDEIRNDVDDIRNDINEINIKINNSSNN